FVSRIYFCFLGRRPPCSPLFPYTTLFRSYNEKAGTVDIDIYANRQPDDFMHSIEQVTEGSLPGESTFGMPAMGSLSPSVMAKTMGIEVANTVRLFELYFGPYPYKHLAVTNIPYSYGQGWPGLLYLSALSFLDSTQRHNLGIRDNIRLTDFFRAHESSHQWWGHRVGWKSYHDQWLSEGFADFSGILYVQYGKNMKEALARWRKEKELLHNKDLHGHVIESLGPIWMGGRITSSATGPGSYQDLNTRRAPMCCTCFICSLWIRATPIPSISSRT